MSKPTPEQASETLRERIKEARAKNRYVGLTADEADVLAHELERLRERDRYDCVCGGELRIERERDAALAESERLREALRKIKSALSITQADDIARAALAGREQPGEGGDYLARGIENQWLEDASA